jgi:Acidic fibroblast growth factor binding (FIBP)
LQQFGATFEMLLNDILDNYRTFGMLERYLKTPTKLADQLEFQIAPSTQAMLIEK